MEAPASLADFHPALAQWFAERFDAPTPVQEQAWATIRGGAHTLIAAPTGSGKTLIFELWSNHGRNPGQAIYTVPTRALANDKLANIR